MTATHPYEAHDTIAATGTPPGRGAIGIVRLSGPHSLAIAHACLASATPVMELEPARLHRAWVIAPDGARVDDVVVAVRHAPASYTGEDMVEVHCHGGRAVVARVMGLLCDAGARPAGPGEFTLRAFLNGKMDLSQAEAVALLIAADTEAQRACAARQLAGGLSAAVGRIYDALTGLAARMEASIEFPDDGVEELPAPELRTALAGAARDIGTLAATWRDGRLVAEGARVVIAGRVNAGKSSLLNVFAGEERAIVTDIPGTTRDPVEALLDWDGMLVRIVDTAGLRDSETLIERIGQERAQRHLDAADAVIYVVDLSSAPDDGDMARLAPVAHKAVVALNKSDLPPALSAAAFTARFPGIAVIRCSALTGDGLPALRTAVQSVLNADRACATADLVVTSARHHALLRDSAGALDRAVAALDTGATPDLFADDLRDAMDALGQITGRAVTDDVLTEIFSKFCIGK